jgi:DNA-binding CsgD family transcriptional regulator
MMAGVPSSPRFLGAQKGLDHVSETQHRPGRSALVTIATKWTNGTARRSAHGDVQCCISFTSEGTRAAEEFSSSRASAGLSRAIDSAEVDDRCVPALGSCGAILPLIGREAETDQIDALIDQLRGGAIVICGEAGVGKSALLEHALARASEVGAQTLVTVGVASEAEFAFAGMHRLLRPIIGPAELLPAPQRNALDAAFGARGDLDPDPFLVALAAHQLVCQAAEARPVALIVDDAHWLDRSTLGVLSFIARRLEDESAVLILAGRDGCADLFREACLPSVRLERLDAEAAAEVLDHNAPDLHPFVRARVLAEAAGNPLALVELARALPSSAGACERLPSTPATLTARLEQAFATRLDGLPEETCAVLLAAALDGRASLDEVTTAASELRGEAKTLSALDPAIDADLVEIDGAELRFRHPLIRSAVMQAAHPGRVLATYGVLAGVVADPERRLWHRAMAAVGCDEELAAALDAHAVVARRRGAVAVAAAALERAAALTPEPVRKGERLVRAAEVAYELGLVETARRLLQQVQAVELGSLELARSAWLKHMLSGEVWVHPGAAKTFVAISRQMLRGGDADMALRSLVPIAHRCWWTGPRDRTREYLVDTAERCGVPDDDPRLLAVIALAHPERTGPKVLECVSRATLGDVADPVSEMYLGIAAEKAGDYVTGERLLARAVERLSEQGTIGMLTHTQVLVYHAWTATYTGNWASAVATGADGARLARDSRQPQYGLTGELIAALATAMSGMEQEVESMLAKPERTLLAMNGGPLLAPAHLARGAAALGDGRPDDAFRHLWPVFDKSSPAFHQFMRWPAILDLVEAGCHGENAGLVRGVLGDLEQVAKQCSPPILCVGLTCARPLLAVDGEAEQLFREALAQDWAGYPFLRARTLFSFGRWLRRERRSADSRVPLRDAISLFDALGANRWSERARQQLRATGETIGQRTPDARDRLTAQELQIAQLAAQGLSNREIGERLFLSHRTIGSHLYRTFPKLEITSRIQLRDALADATHVTDQAVT